MAGSAQCRSSITEPVGRCDAFGGQEPGPRREGLFAVRAEPRSSASTRPKQWSQPSAQPAGLVLSRF